MLKKYDYPNEPKSPVQLQRELDGIKDTTSEVVFIHFLMTLEGDLKHLPNILDLAYRCQRRWYGHWNRAWGAKQKRETMQDLSEEDRKFSFVGYLYVNGEEVPPHEWKAKAAAFSRSIRPVLQGSGAL
jgi:hypothetical protein